jgi:tetratricopeptide (TPR) repeat protein
MNQYDRRTVLREIVASLVEHGQFADAQRIVATMNPKDVECRDAARSIAAGLARSGKHEQSLAMADFLPYADDRQAVYQYVIDAQADAGNYVAARATADRMPLGEKLAPPHPPPEYARTRAYSSIAWKQLAHQDIAGARATAASLDRDTTAQLECAIAKALIESGDLATARAVANRIPPEARGSFGKSAQDDARESLAFALARSGEITAAAEIAHALPNSTEALLDVAECAISLGRTDQASPLVQEIVERSKHVGAHRDNNFRLEPAGDMIALRLAVLQKALGNAGPYDDAIEDLNRKVNEADNPDARRAAALKLFSLYVREKDLMPARRLARVVPPDVLSWVIASLATAAARGGDLERAKALADFMPTPADRANVLQSILDSVPHSSATPAEQEARIRQLPSAYDRSLAFLARAQASWSETKKNSAP